MDTGRVPPAEGGKGTQAGNSAAPEGRTEKQEKQTFASVLNRNTSFTRLNLTYTAPILLEGKPVVEIPAAVTMAGETRWKHTLIGHVLGLNPRLQEMINYTRIRWKEAGELVVHQMGRGLFVYQFSTEEAKQRTLEQGPWSFSRRPLILRPWEIGMPLDKPVIERLPVWIQLPYLPLDLWTAEGLSLVASYVGTPQYADRNTSEQQRLAYARVCVEIGVESELPKIIPVKYANGHIHHQAVVYEWLPAKCGKCGIFGHAVQECSRGMDQTMTGEDKGKGKIVMSGEVQKTTSGTSNSGDVLDEMGCEKVQNVEIELDASSVSDGKTVTKSSGTSPAKALATITEDLVKEDVKTPSNEPGQLSTYANIVKQTPVISKGGGVGKVRKGGGKKKPQVYLPPHDPCLEC